MLEDSVADDEDVAAELVAERLDETMLEERPVPVYGNRTL